MAIELKIGFTLDEQDLKRICDCWNEEVANAESGSDWEDRNPLTVNDIVSIPSLAGYISAQIQSHLDDHWGDMGSEMIWDADMLVDLEDHR